MNNSTLKSNIHKIVEKTQDERLLQAIYDFLQNKETGKPGQLWASLSAKEKEEVLQSFEESEDESNLIDKDDLLNRLNK